MQSLAQLLQNKRKLDNAESDSSTKYLKRGDLLRRQSSHKEEEQEKKQQQQQHQHQPPENTQQPPSPTSSKDFDISDDDCIHRLRAKSEPIRLFGESDKERRLRLRALELLHSSAASSKGQQNDLHKALEGIGQAELQQLDSTAAPASASTKVYTEEELLITWQMIKVDKDRLYATIYKWLKNMLRLWENSLAQRPEEVRRSKQGQLTTANQVQTANYLKPLFKLLKSKTIQPDVLCLLGEILLYAQERKYQNANDAYLRLSIGNAPWPIGVTMVGIHDRSAREKISNGSVAHVLNDEVSRKYIQSVKRVLTFAQSQFPPSDMSQRVG
ncbi:hypothetical protein E3P99_03534 [Wallemia hederae]|uniref:Pre-mRNA-splicing factor 18 n=1 Tax=Wallemia hederae TaxID=1540922 RepID=A0A4V6TMB0_9BASI|nr:hypothetical protein E3P99_03534 [Wallemia hederae]